MNPRPIQISIEPCPAGRSDEAAAFLRRVFYDEFAFTPDPVLDKDFGDLVAHYRRGRGEIWIAHDGARIVATTALLDLTITTSSPENPARTGGDTELKRMFVDQSLRGLGVGRQLLDAAIAHARAAAFDRIVLDSKNDMTAALALYRSAGFKEIPDYNGNRRAEVFMALDLRADHAATPSTLT